MIEAWGMSQAAADEVLVAWEAEADRRGLQRLDARFWSSAEEWMKGRLR